MPMFLGWYGSLTPRQTQNPPNHTKTVSKFAKMIKSSQKSESQMVFISESSKWCLAYNDYLLKQYIGFYRTNGTLRPSVYNPLEWIEQLPPNGQERRQRYQTSTNNCCESGHRCINRHCKFGKSTELAHIAKSLYDYTVEKKEQLVTLEEKNRTPESNIFPQVRVCIIIYSKLSNLHL